MQSIEDFTGEIMDRWAGREVRVSKTVPIPPINIRIERVGVTHWDDVDKRIQQKHSRDTSFLVVSGPMQVGDRVESRENVIQSLVIPVDEGTVYDVRKERLVVITDSEVVEFSLTGH